MRYVCIKQLTAGGRVYHPGEPIPDGVILPGRSGKLVKSGYISELGEAVPVSGGTDEELFTKEQVTDMVARELAVKLSEAMAEMEKERADQLAELQGQAAELLETAPGAWEGAVQIPVRNTSNGGQEQISVVFANAEEIRQAFSIMQMNAEEGAKEISGVDSENVLILLHASDSRVTIKNAAKKRADNLFSTDDEKKAAEGIAKDEGVMDGRGGDA